MRANDLENALNNVTKDESPKTEFSQMSANTLTNSDEGKVGAGPEEIGFHKGALNTLIAERNELVKMVGNVEAITLTDLYLKLVGVCYMQAHIKRLEEFGVKLNGK